MVLYWHNVAQIKWNLYSYMDPHISSTERRWTIFPVHSISLMHSTYESFKSPNYPSNYPASELSFFSVRWTRRFLCFWYKRVASTIWSHRQRSMAPTDQPRTSLFWIVNVVVLLKFLNRTDLCRHKNSTTHFCSGGASWRFSIKGIFYSSILSFRTSTRWLILI